MNNAEKFIELNKIHFTKMSDGGFAASCKEIDSIELIELIQEHCTVESEIMGQETYTFSDRSYITKSSDIFYIGDDVTLFETEEDLN